MRTFDVVCGAAAALLYATAALAGQAPLSGPSIEGAGFQPSPDRTSHRPERAVVKAEVLLARAGFSPGSIDGVGGDNLRHALATFQKQLGLPVSGALDQATWEKLAADRDPVTTRYAITAADARGPFTLSIPKDFERQASLRRLGYRNLREALAERFHMSPDLLAAMNPGRASTAGTTIDVVVPWKAAAQPSGARVKAAGLVVDKTGHQVEAFGADGKLLMAFPASIGSAEKPAPTGRFEIKRIAHHPDYTYLPRFQFKGVASRRPFTIAPGPNNPVGVVWMDLSYDGYGIHGTPEPELVGKTQSHGCIRLTNWDVEALATIVDAGTLVTFQDGADDPIPAPPAAPSIVPTPMASTPAAPVP